VIEGEGEKEERVAPDMAHLRVVPAAINGIGEEEVLLDSSSQIVSMTKKVAAACHKLHSAISSPILQRFPRSQSELKALKKTFRSVPVTSQSNQYWPRY